MKAPGAAQRQATACNGAQRQAVKKLLYASIEISPVDQRLCLVVRGGGGGHVELADDVPFPPSPPLVLSGHAASLIPY